jgi:hypothetical protein
MNFLTQAEAANVLEAADIHQTIDAGHAIVHFGTDESGRKFVLINNMEGASVISEAM